MEKTAQEKEPDYAELLKRDYGEFHIEDLIKSLKEEDGLTDKQVYVFLEHNY